MEVKSFPIKSQLAFAGLACREQVTRSRRQNLKPCHILAIKGLFGRMAWLRCLSERFESFERFG